MATKEHKARKDADAKGSLCAAIFEPARRLRTSSGRDAFHRVPLLFSAFIAPLRLDRSGFLAAAPLLSALLLQSSGLLLAAAPPGGPEEIPPLRPPQAELGPSFWEQYGLWVIIAGVLLLGIIGVVVWRLTRPKPPIPVPPATQARQALAPLTQQPEDGALLSRVSQILRHYVTAAFGLPPGELTTTEFCRALAGQESVGPELAGAVSNFLRQCDQRKFAPATPASPLGAAGQAAKLIDQAEARRAALAAPAGQVAAGPGASAAHSGEAK